MGKGDKHNIPLEDRVNRLATFDELKVKPTRRDWLKLALRDIGDILKQELVYAFPYDAGTLADGLTGKVKQFANYFYSELADTAHNYKLIFQHPRESKHALKELGEDVVKLIYEVPGYLSPFSADYSIDKRISHAVIGSNISGITLGGLVVTSLIDNQFAQIASSSFTCEAIAAGGFIVSFPILTEATNLWRRNRYGKRISGNKAPETLNRLKKMKDYMKNVGAAATISFGAETALISLMTYAPKAISTGVSALVGGPWDFELPSWYSTVVTTAGLTIGSSLFIMGSKVSNYHLNNHHAATGHPLITKSNTKKYHPPTYPVLFKK